MQCGLVCGISLIINKIIRNFTERLTEWRIRPYIYDENERNPIEMVIFNLGYQAIGISYVRSRDFITNTW